MHKIIAAAIALLLTSSALAEQAPYAPLSEQQMSVFLNTLSEISMPNRVYQQIIGLYQQLEHEAQKTAKQKSTPTEKDGK